MKKQTPNSDVLSRWKNRDKKEVTSNAISKAPEGATIPLSRSQRRLWFLQLLYPKNHFYNYSERYEFEGELDTEKLIKALELSCDTHDILSSTYHMEEGQLFFKVTPESNIQVSQHDLSNLESSEAEKATKEILTTDAQYVFDLTMHPVVLVSLIKIHQTKHILLLTIHHISTDKWSMGLLRKDWADNYKVLCSNSTVERKKLDIQYSDFAYWQHNQKVDQKQLGYWRNQLAGEIPFINLPLDFPKPAEPSFKGCASPTHCFTRNQSSKILNLAKELEVTPYVLFLSVYYVLLFRYSGQKDILIGSPVANRDHKSLENLVGFFNDTVVLRAELSANMGFKELVAKVKATTLEAFSNKDVPFDTLVKELKQERSLSINPFFQVMFLYHSVPETPSFGPDLQLEHGVFDTGVSKFDLTLYISEKEGILSSTFEYATDLFTASSVERFQEHINLLLAGIVENQSQSISDIPMISQKENQFFLKQKAKIDILFGNYNGIHEIIADMSRQNPDEIAVSFKSESITYRELEARATFLAKTILSKTQKRNEVVGLCIDRSLEMIVGLLGILKAGCAYLPIDPDYPSDRINLVLNDARVKLVVINDEEHSTLERGDFLIIKLSELDGANTINHDDLPQVKPDDVAYVIYTSGSTGRPKGVPISHKNIMNSTLGRTEFYKTDPSSFLLMSSISFDSSKAGIFWTLCKGGNLVVSEKRLEQDIELLVSTIKDNKVSHTLMLPTLYNAVLDFGSLEELESLTTVIVAGEACTTNVCEKHFEVFSTVDMYNEYGPTEASVWCIAHKIEKNDLGATIPIGKPVANAEVYILDEDLRHVPFGATGNLYIGGIGLSKGYMSGSEVDADPFINSPFSDTASDKIYRTGDLARYDTNGNLQFLGRQDQQVKIRGFRIEIKEIEKVIQDYNTVEKAVVMVQENKKVSNVDLDEMELTDLVTLAEGKLGAEELNRIVSSIETLSKEEENFLHEKFN